MNNINEDATEVNVSVNKDAEQVLVNRLRSDVFQKLEVRFAKDRNPEIRDLIAQRSNVSKEALAVLAVDEDMGVRACVAENFSVSAEILHTLIDDPEDDIRKAVANNPNTSAKTLTDLTPEQQQVAVGEADDLHNLKELFLFLNEQNRLNEHNINAFLTCKVPFTQTELMEMCELYGKETKQLIIGNYVLSHPLLKHMLVDKSVGQMHQRCL